MAFQIATITKHRTHIKYEMQDPRQTKDIFLIIIPHMIEYYIWYAIVASQSELYLIS